MKSRFASLDLLKILAIFLIVSFHAVYKGIPASIVNEFSCINQVLYYLFYHFGELGVNLFMLITGFFLIDSKQVRISKIVKIISNVYFFTAISIVVSIVMKKYIFHIQDLLPITFTYYWYITGYLIIYILSPFINRFVKKISRKEFQKLLITLFMFFSVIPTIAGLIVGGTEELSFYNRFTWLLFLYLVGGYLSIYRDKLSLMTSPIRKSLTFFSKLIIFTGLFAIFAYFAKINTRFFNISPTFFWGPNSIVMFFISVLLFSIFYHLEIPNNKLISAISETTLTVYLLHEHPKFVAILWSDIFSFTPFYFSKKLFPIIIGASLIIIIVGALVHHIKRYTFDRLLDNILLKTHGVK